MNAAYVDSSWWVAAAFGDGIVPNPERLIDFDDVFAANLLEAEVRAAFRRRQKPFDKTTLEPLSWVLPDRPLGKEIARVLDAGYLKGADLWHLAVALYLSPDPSELVFLTLDERQGEVARQLGFPTS